jgi:hypothetical protein
MTNTRCVLAALVLTATACGASVTSTSDGAGGGASGLANNAGSGLAGSDVIPAAPTDAGDADSDAGDGFAGSDVIPAAPTDAGDADSDAGDGFAGSDVIPAAPTDAGDADSDAGAVLVCDPGAAMTGTAYDLSKSRFAFGSVPVREDTSTMTRWVGTDGVVAIQSCGREGASMNAGAAAADLADWSSDPSALGEHVRDYFVSMGMDPCQIANTWITSGSLGQRTIGLSRGVDGIVVVGSGAFARLNVNDQSTSEGFYWPTVPADTVSAARTFRDQLADPAALAAFKAKLPANAQGKGGVVIHHSPCGLDSSSSFQTAATYDVVQSNPMGGGGTVSFDAQANPVSTIW